MSFLYPSFLWALGVISVPILIHLFNFRRTSKVFFSNTRFLRQIKEVTTAKRRLKHYLILASRIIFLAFLVFAFSQPVIPAREQLGAARTIHLYIDNSQSMSAQQADKTRSLDAALMMSRNIVEVFPPDTRYKILTNDFAPFSNSFKTRPEALDILAQIRFSPVSRSAQEIADRLMQDSRGQKDVFWISDFQKSTIAPIPAQLDTLNSWHLIPLSYGKVSNVFIDTAYLQNPFAASGEKNVLTIKARNDGTSDVEQLNIKLTINGIQAGTTLVNIPAKGTTETSFDLASGLTGLNKAQFTFGDFPVSFDNDFYLSINFTEKINVLEVKAAGNATPVQRVFGNPSIFNFKSFSVNNFNYSLLNQADLVVINGLNKIDQSLSMSLRNYLSQQAGTILLIPGSTPDVATYQTLSGNKILSVVSQGALSELDKPDFSNPFFENVFEERSTSLAMPKATRLLSWGSDRNAILQFKNDQPFLSRIDQTGKLYLLASPLQNDFTDFFNHALFVPVMYRIAASGKKNESRLYYTLREDFIRLRLDTILADKPLKLVGNQEVVPPQRSVNNEVLMEIPKFSVSQGFYNIVAQDDTINLIAFNLNKEESLLDQYSGNEVKNQMGNGSNITIFEAGSAEAFSDEIKARYLGKPLWKYAIFLALLFLLAEVLFIRFLK
jgi:hypothetical protein